jgi:hypothetical protein
MQEWAVMDKTMVVMAAGMGSRYGGLKQLDQIGPSGETIIDYSVYDALRAGFNKVVFVIRRDIEEAFKEQVGSRFADKVEVRYVYQALEDLPEGFSVPEGRTKPWGTGHAMLTAAAETAEPFIILNADDFYGADAFRTAAAFLDTVKPGELKAALVGFLLKNTLSENGSVARGICGADGNGMLTDVEEILGIQRDRGGKLIADNRDNLREDDLVSMNMWAFSPAVFDYTLTYFERFLTERARDPKAEFYIPTAVNILIKEESAGVKVLETSSEWFGVTYREDKPAVAASIAAYVEKGLYPSDLWGRR